MAAPAQQVPTFKLVLVGDGGTGKVSPSLSPFTGAGGGGGQLAPSARHRGASLHATHRDPLTAQSTQTVLDKS